MIINTRAQSLWLISLLRTDLTRPLKHKFWTWACKRYRSKRYNKQQIQKIIKSKREKTITAVTTQQMRYLSKRFENQQKVSFSKKNFSNKNSKLQIMKLNKSIKFPKCNSKLLVWWSECKNHWKQKKYYERMRCGHINYGKIIENSKQKKVNWMKTMPHTANTDKNDNRIEKRRITQCSQKEIDEKKRIRRKKWFKCIWWREREGEKKREIRIELWIQCNGLNGGHWARYIYTYCMQPLFVYVMCVRVWQGKEMNANHSFKMHRTAPVAIYALLFSPIYLNFSFSFIIVDYSPVWVLLVLILHSLFFSLSFSLSLSFVCFCSCLHWWRASKRHKYDNTPISYSILSLHFYLSSFFISIIRFIFSI